ncbi:TPA: cobalamin B12-binding domain-containing protein [Candidatus Poribacteria bacterium]|nr:cobalamin B12-binding domain-containing protein [Candidatus Poribacteria bacterium]
MKKILGASLGECAHVAGTTAFLNLAKQQGYKTIFLGPAIPINSLVNAIKRENPDIVAVSYRLTPATAKPLLKRFINTIKKANLHKGRKYIFGGTEPVADIAKQLKFFNAIFGGKDSTDDVIAFLQGRKPKSELEADYPQRLVERIEKRKPFPIIRHHFGLPTVEATIKGVREIAEARVLDIISLGSDQDAQENFFHPERQDESRRGAGGVPVRTEDDFWAIYSASRCGNYPLMRCYAGTDDLIKLAEMYVKTINLCFGAIPIFWFNVLDNRGPMALEESIRVHQETIRWHAERDIPVEVNEPHQWSLRGAPDQIYVATAYLSAYIAKKLSVKDYIAQYMFNTPAGVSFKMDLAKMLACIDLVEELQNEDFIVHRETRAGLLSYPVDVDMAKGQLASSVMLQMALKPQILHVVAYCEADHAAFPSDIIESCKIARKVVENAIYGMPDMTVDPEVLKRKEELKKGAKLLIEAIRNLDSDTSGDPLLDPKNLANAVRMGFLDAPELTPTENSKGAIVTSIIDGACYAVNPETEEIISEEERLDTLQGT